MEVATLNLLSYVLIVGGLLILIVTIRSRAVTIVTNSATSFQLKLHILTYTSANYDFDIFKVENLFLESELADDIVNWLKYFY